DILAADGIEASVVDMATIKPIDVDLILQQAATTGAIVTVENHNIIGGLGSAVAEVLVDEGMGLPFKRVGIQDQFCEGGTTPYLMRKFGLDDAAICEAARIVLQKKG
ncbi:MAG: transketolase C-terminal domain-containing protein, partial [Pseudomonadota bacterium]